jgi:uncharacterized surface protein with fasciclin (FAS1) repeats
MKVCAIALLGALTLSFATRAETLDARVEPLPAAERTVMDVLESNGHYKILVSALNTTGLSEKLNTAGPYTFFAPTDEAFQRVPKLSELLANDAELKIVLMHHIIENRRLDTMLLRGESMLIPMTGKALKVSAGPELHIDDDAKIVNPNNDTRTGIVHGIDHVLMKNNDSALGEAGATVEQGLKDGTDKVYDGLKTGARKIKNAFE